MLWYGAVLKTAPANENIRRWIDFVSCSRSKVIVTEGGH